MQVIQNLLGGSFMNNNLTEIIFLLDRSGSMQGLESDTIGGFNSFVKKQDEIGDTRLTTVLFDDKYEILHNGINAKDVQLTGKEYFARGQTALLDAVGKTIADVNHRLATVQEWEKPGKVLFIITTDGLENASSEYDYEKVKKAITEQTEKSGWEFIFMGANIDVAKGCSNLGIAQNRAFSYTASAAGTMSMFCSLTGIASDLRLNKKANKKT
jgi:uncharacterized protein YegL